MGEVSNESHPSDQCDTARRWNHISVATGLTTKSEDIQDIIMVCQLFDQLLFLPGPTCLGRTYHVCGSLCALQEVLLDIGREYYNIIGYTSFENANAMRLGLIQDPIDGIDYESNYDGCRRRQGFIEENEDRLTVLKNAIVALPDNIRLEMILFQYERIGCKSGLTMIDSEYKPLWSMDGSLPLRGASLDYSRLLAGENADQLWCYMHGTFHSCNEPGEENERDDITVETVNSSDEESDE